MTDQDREAQARAAMDAFAARIKDHIQEIETEAARRRERKRGGSTLARKTGPEGAK